MLFADKQALETELKVSLLAIRERELDLYTGNCRNIGSQAALLAGFAYGALTYGVVDNSEICTVFKAVDGSTPHGECAKRTGGPEFTIGAYQLIAFLAMMLNFAAAFGATVISMLGPGLALRGQDGAMDQAVEGLALEYRTVFLLFMGGVFAYYMCFSIFLAVDYDSSYGLEDLMLHFLLVGCLIYFVRSTLGTTKRIYKKFRLPPEMAVAGSFDENGMPKGMQCLSPEAIELERLCVNKKWYQWPRRQYLYVNVFMDEFLGISAKVFAERYKTVSMQHKATTRRPNNHKLHSIIRHLEVPGASHLGRPTKPRSEGSCDKSSTRSPRPMTTSNARPASSWLWRGGEEKRGLAAADGAAATEVELSSMALSPADHLNSGAISPADSDVAH